MRYIKYLIKMLVNVGIGPTHRILKNIKTLRGEKRSEALKKRLKG